MWDIDILSKNHTNVPIAIMLVSSYQNWRDTFDVTRAKDHINVVIVRMQAQIPLNLSGIWGFTLVKNLTNVTSVLQDLHRYTHLNRHWMIDSSHSVSYSLIGFIHNIFISYVSEQLIESSSIDSHWWQTCLPMRVVSDHLWKKDGSSTSCPKATHCCTTSTL